MTSSMPWKRAPSCATGPQRKEHPLFCWSMPNPSNAPRVATSLPPFSSGERMFPSPQSSKLALLTLLIFSGSWSGSGVARAQAAAAAPPAAPSGVAFSSFRPAPASVPGALSPSFAVFRNLDALYDVLLRVTETAALAGSGSDAGSLEDARAGLEDGRGKLGTWLLQSIGNQDAQIVHLQAAASTRPAAAP